MNDQEAYDRFAQVNEMMLDRYGCQVDDYCDEDEVMEDIRNEEDPEAIVEDIAATYDLKRIDNPPDPRRPGFLNVSMN